MVFIYATSKHSVYVPNVILSILMLCVCELQSACIVFQAMYWLHYYIPLKDTKVFLPFGPSLISCGRMNDEFISKWHCAGHPGDARCNHEIYRKLAEHSLVFRRKNVLKWWIFYLYVGFVGAVQEIFSLLCSFPPCPRAHEPNWNKVPSGIDADLEVWEHVFGSQGCRTKPVFLRVTHLNHVQFASPIWIPRASQDAFRPLYSSFEIAMFNWWRLKNIELTKTNQPIFNVFQTSWHFMPFSPGTQTDIHSNVFFRPLCFSSLIL